MTSKNNEYGEKRNFIRMFINTQVTITDPFTGDTFDGQSRDLSGDGISIVTSKEFQLGQELELHICSKHDTMSPLTASLKVKRIIKLDDGMFELAGFIDRVS